MSAVIIKFPRWAKFRTKAQQVQINKLFRAIKKKRADMSDRDAFVQARAIVRFEQRIAELYKARGITTPAGIAEARASTKANTRRAA